ncbi:MAG: SMC-Scp complex subunit ScpB [Candidatus Melainabacteria bacterium]|nr:MAG: SMC-Scp complex subunit ScpB [Candidatus Melainabacteria bacterium]
MSLKSKIEAVLFLTDKPLRAQAVARIVNEDVQVVRQAILELINDYETRQGGLEISDDDGYIVQVKDEYASIIDEFVPMELPTSLLRTLSAIAIKQPVAQSEIIKIRGVGAYDHIKELMERELVVKKEEGGRSPLLTTTKKFQEYFRLSHDAKSLRQELKSQDKAADEAAGVEAAVIETVADVTAVEETTVASDTESSDAEAEPVFEPPAAEETIQVDPVSIPGNAPEAVLSADEIRT